MVNLILQPVFLNLVKGSIDLKMTSDDFYNMWSVATKAKTAIVQGRRLENLSWRLWYTSTIRSKAELEERKKKHEGKRRKNKENVNDEDLFDENEECECSNSSSNGDLSNPDSTDSAATLPSDRPLFTSTCTSILAEIQDASFKFGQGSLSINFNNLHSNHNTHVHLNNFNAHSSVSSHTHTHANTHTHIHTHTHTNTHPHSHIKHSQQLDTQTHEQQLNSVSPPNQQISRVKSPAQTLPRKKKNVEKFLKKFKSNLEDITERFEEKITFTTDDDDEVIDIDEETVTKEDKDKSVPITLNLTNNNNNNEQERHMIDLSPTSSNHFATDEEGHDYSFYSRSSRIDDLIYLEKRDVMNKKKKQDSMISKLLKFEEISSSPEYFKPSNYRERSNSNSTDNTNCSNSNISKPLNITPIHSQAPNFQLSSNTQSSSSLSNHHHQNQNQIDLLISNRYDRIRNPLMSPKPVDHDFNKNFVRTEGTRIGVDANALSTSLSTSKFSLDDEFDSQIVIW